MIFTTFINVKMSNTILTGHFCQFLCTCCDKKFTEENIMHTETNESFRRNAPQKENRFEIPVNRRVVMREQLSQVLLPDSFGGTASWTGGKVLQNFN